MEEKITLLKRMIELNMPLEDIISATRLKKEEILKIKKQLEG